MKYSPNVLLRILDGFLSPQQLVSANLRMRGRIAVFGPLNWALLNIFVLFFQKFYTSTQVLTTLAYLSTWVTSLILIKKAFSPEKVVAGAIAINTAIAIVEVNLSAETNPFHMFGLLSMVYFVCLVITNLKMRTLTLLVLFAGTLICILTFSSKVGSQSMVLPSSMPEGLIYAVGVVTTAQIILYSMILRIKAIAQSDLDQEIEWQQRRIRLEEASSMTNTMRLLLTKPIQDIREDLGYLQESHDAIILKRMQATLAQLLLISQSYGWIYRAYGHEGASSIQSNAFMDQLEVLLSSKANEKGWDFGVAQQGSTVEIYGPVPAIMLLLLTIVIQILEEPRPLEKRTLILEFNSQATSITWTMRWPYYAQDFEIGRNFAVESEMSSVSRRKELIRELTQNCKANVEENQDQSGNEILISGSWRRLKGAHP